MFAMPFAVLPLASSFKISVSRSDKVNSVETSWQIASISVGLTGALVNSKMLVSRFVKGIMRKAFEDYCLAHSKYDIEQEFADHRIAAQVVNDFEDLVEEEHLKLRNLG
mgnify:FL=1